MATIVTRSGKGSPLTNAEVDGNFTNLNTELGTKLSTASLATVATTGAYSDLTGKPTNVSSFTNDSAYVTSAALSAYQPLDGDLTAIAALAGTTGFVTKTAANTYTLDTSSYLTGITSGQVTTALGFTPYNATNPSGFISSITSANVTTALGFTPYNSTNPAGYITSSALSSYLPLNGGSLSGALTVNGNIAAASSAVFADRFENYGGPLILNSAASLAMSLRVNNTERMTINASGNVTANVDIRAPIFYDSNNTGFFVDPAGTSAVTNLLLADNGSIQFNDRGRDANTVTNPQWSSRSVRWDFVGAGSVGTGGNYAGLMTFVPWVGTTASTGDASYQMAWGSTGANGTGVPHLRIRKGIDATWNSFYTIHHDGFDQPMYAASSFRAPIFYDSNDTAYYVDPNSTSRLSVANVNFLTLLNDEGLNVKGIRGQFAAGSDGQGISLFSNVDIGYPSGWGAGLGNTPSRGLSVYGGLRVAYSGGGFITSDTSVRSPIFYDSDNTAYYTDPASTSNLNNLTLNTGPVYRSDWTTRFQSGSDFVDGTLVTTDIPATAGAGDSFVIEITGKSYNQDNPPFKVVAQGYLYNDTIINYSGISYAGNFATYIKVFQDGGVLKFWWPRISYWNSFNVNVMAMDGPTNNTISRNRVTAIGNAAEPTATKKVQITLTKTLKTGDAAGSISGFNNPVTAPTANTIVYRDSAGDISAREIVLSSGLSAQTPTVLVSMYPATNQMVRTTPAAVSAAIQGAASGSWPISVTGSAATAGKATNLNQARYSNTDFNTLGSTGQFFRAYTNYIPSGGSYNQPPNGSGDYKVIQWGDVEGGDGATAGNWGGQIVQNFYTDQMWFRRSYATTWQAWREFIHDGNYTSFAMPIGSSATNSVDVRAPIFYDSNDTAYYINPNATSVINGLNVGGSTPIFSNSSFQYHYHQSSHVAYVKKTGPYSWYWRRNDTGLAGANEVEDMSLTDDGNLFVRSSVRAPIFYDSNDTGYFLNPNSTSSLYNTLTIGPNTTYARYLRLGGNAGDVTEASIAPSNGNLHIDAKSGYNLYLSWYNTATTQVGGGIAATLYYDQSNTAYYLDPTAIQSLRTVGDWRSDSSAWTGEFNGKIQYHADHWYFQSAGQWIFRKSDGQTAFEAYQNGTAIAYGDMRSPLFYDNNNTGYYADPNGTSRMGTINSDLLRSYTNVFTDQNHGYGLVGVYSSYRYQGVFAMGDSYKLPADGTTTGSLYGICWSHPNAGGVAGNLNSHGALFLENGSFLAAVSGSIRSRDDMRSPIFYDSNDTGYFINPNGDSNLSKTFTYIGGRDINANWNTGFQNTPPQAYNFHGDISSGGPAGTWWFYESMRHSNASNYWGTQIAWGWEDNANRLQQRNVSGNSFSAWVEYLNTSGRTYSGNLTMTGSIISSASDVRAPIFYDQNNTAYYVDPNATSNLLGLTVANTITGSVSGNAGNVTGTVAVANGGTGATTLTANNVLLGNGTSAVQVVAPSTTGNVLTSDGTTWVSSAPVMTLISTSSPSSASQIVFTGLTSAYTYYEIVFETSAGNIARCQLSTDNGATFQNSFYYSSATTFGTSTVTQAGTSGAGQTYIDLGGASYSGVIRFLYPTSTNDGGSNIQSQTQGLTATSSFRASGRRISGGHNAIRLFPATGTFTGTFKLYGVKA